MRLRREIYSSRRSVCELWDGATVLVPDRCDVVGEAAMKRVVFAVVTAVYLATAPGLLVQAADQKAKPKAEAAREPDVIFVPTPHDVVDKMLELAQPKKGDLVYDLGCGDGRIVIAAAKKSGCKAVGFDIDPERIKESLENVKKSGMEALVSIERRDIFTLDLSPANVVTLYLLPELNVRLIPQLEKLKPGSRIVSHDFRMKGVKPDKKVEVTSEEDETTHKVFLWTTPLKKRKPKQSG